MLLRRLVVPAFAVLGLIPWLHRPVEVVHRVEQAFIPAVYATTPTEDPGDTPAISPVDTAKPLVSVDPVVARQDELRALGCDPGPSDGIPGPRTEAAERCARGEPDPVRVTSSSGYGQPTLDQWIKIAVCESGNTNGWRTGYFGIEAGYPIGHLSWDEQLAWANDIYAKFGPSAWGCPF